MGEENQKEEKDKSFNGFTIDNDLVRKAKKDAIVLHCLPAYISKEITDEVFESKNNRIFDQAENRLHALKVMNLILWLLIKHMNYIKIKIC